MVEKKEIVATSIRGQKSSTLHVGNSVGGTMEDCRSTTAEICWDFPQFRTNRETNTGDDNMGGKCRQEHSANCSQKDWSVMELPRDTIL
jgi:hypothetical protein